MTETPMPQGADIPALHWLDTQGLLCEEWYGHGKKIQGSPEVVFSNMSCSVA